MSSARMKRMLGRGAGEQAASTENATAITASQVLFTISEIAITLSRRLLQNHNALFLLPNHPHNLETLVHRPRQDALEAGPE